MSCTRPLKAWQIGINSETQKPKYLITNYQTTPIRVNGKKMVSSKNGTLYSFTGDFIEIPCGKCTACRLDHAKNWSNRCMLEMKYHDSNYFVTLTYDNEHLNYIDDDGTYHNNLRVSYDSDGQIINRPTLNKKDLQDFFKRLRDKLDYPIRYFACGEYGDSTKRPHYHVIIFGLKLDDLKFYKKSEIGNDYYTSDFLTSTWKQGYVVVTNVTPETVAYTARYTTKKAFGIDNKYYTDLNIEPEFIVMSRRPGIAKQYFEDEYIKKGKKLSEDIIVSSANKGLKFKPSRYFEKLYDEIDHEDLVRLKSARLEDSKAMQEIKSQQTSLSYLDQKLVEESVLNKKIKALRRKEI